MHKATGSGYSTNPVAGKPASRHGTRTLALPAVGAAIGEAVRLGPGLDRRGHPCRHCVSMMFARQSPGFTTVSLSADRCISVTLPGGGSMLAARLAEMSGQRAGRPLAPLTCSGVRPHHVATGARQPHQSGGPHPHGGGVEGDGGEVEVGGPSCVMQVRHLAREWIERRATRRLHIRAECAPWPVPVPRRRRRRAARRPSVGRAIG